MMNNTEKNGLRMYFFVLRQLSGINKGIQAGHAALEYGFTFNDKKEYQDFLIKHKTFIVLDGGGSECMKQRAEELHDFGINYEGFFEPDLGGCLSALAFIVPESVYGIDLDDEDTLHRACDFKLAMYLKRFKLASN